MAIVNGEGSTLEQIAARLKEINEGARDVKALPVVKHEATGLSFRVGPMSRADYDSWQAIRTQEDLRHESSGAAKIEAPKDKDKSDSWLLAHAVFAESGENLNAEIIKLLLSGEGFGPSTHILCESAATQNPPRSQLAGEIQALWGFCSEMVIFLRLVTNGRKENEVTDFLVGSPEEKAAAARDLSKIEQTLPFWEGVFSAQDAAKEIDAEIYNRLEASFSGGTDG